MLLVKENNKLKAYGDIKSNDLLPLINLENNKVYMVTIYMKDNTINKINIIKEIKKEENKFMYFNSYNIFNMLKK